LSGTATPGAKGVVNSRVYAEAAVVIATVMIAPSTVCLVMFLPLSAKSFRLASASAAVHSLTPQP
jgi:hypothetical protein